MQGGASTAHSGTLVSGSPLQGVGAAVSGAALADCVLWGRGGCEKGSPGGQEAEGKATGGVVVV